MSSDSTIAIASPITNNNYIRASQACITCSKSRVKCEGAVPGSTTCARCARRGDKCEFTEPKKRGPKGPRSSTIGSTIKSLPSTIPIDAETLFSLVDNHDESVNASNSKIGEIKQRRSRDISDDDNDGDNDGDNLSPITKKMNLNTNLLSLDDYFLISSYFKHCNVMVPCVDEIDFRKMLEVLEEKQKKILSESQSLFSLESQSKGLFAEVTDGNFAAFRVLLHTVICCASLIEGRKTLARHHYGVSCALIPLCLDMSSKHLVSALLVLSLISRSLGKGGEESLEHMRLARIISDQAIGVSLEVKTTALVLYEINAPSPLKCALTLQARIQGMDGVGTGMSLSAGIEAREQHERLALFLGNVMRWIYVFIYDPDMIMPFMLTPKTVMLDLWNTVTLLLKKCKGIYQSVPLKCIVVAGSAYIHFSKGNVAVALQTVSRCLNLAFQEPLELCFHPTFILLHDLVSKAQKAIAEIKQSFTESSTFDTIDLPSLETDIQKFLHLSEMNSSETNAKRKELLNLTAIFWPSSLNIVTNEIPSGPELEEVMRQLRSLELKGEVATGTVDSIIEYRGLEPDIGTAITTLPLLFVPPPEETRAKVTPTTTDLLSTFINSSVGYYMSWEENDEVESKNNTDFAFEDFDVDSALDIVDPNVRSRGYIMDPPSSFLISPTLSC
jgi:hypothetical protein